MGLLNTISRAWENSGDQLTRSSSLSNPSEWLVNAMGGAMTSSGVRVNATSAMKYGAVYSCVRLISRTIASLDIGMILETDGITKPANDHHLYPVLHDAPFKYYTAKIFWELLISQSQRNGVGYALIKRDQRGYVEGLCLLDYTDVFPLLTKTNQKPWETEYFRVTGQQNL